MPGQNGYELTKDIKKEIKVPIILLTAKGEVENRIKGLELGADDYIGKPFEPKELLLRIKNIIKNNIRIDLNSEHIIGMAKIDLNKMSVSLNEKNRKINNSEKRILVEMLSNPGKTYSREEIGKISGISQERSIDVMITRLRQKIEIEKKNHELLREHKYLKEKIKSLQTEVKKKSDLEDNFNQEIEELSQETEDLVSEIEKWQM